MPRYVFEVIAPASDSKDQLLALSDRVRRKELAAFLEIGKDALLPQKPVEEEQPLRQRHQNRPRHARFLLHQRGRHR